MTPREANGCVRLTGQPPPFRELTCIEHMAAAWAERPRLCPGCMSAFMTALDGISGPLRWHQSWRDQAVTA